MGLMLLLIIVPGIFLNRWLTAKEKRRKQRGFEVMLTKNSETKESEQERD